MSNAPIANAQQYEHWNGPEAQHWVAHGERYDRALARFGDRLLGAAEIQPGDAVLDVGCGCGATTIAAAQQAPEGNALGIDLSGSMLELARRRTQGRHITNARFEQGDAQTLALPHGGFDVTISRFGVMFFDDPAAAFANIRTALRPGGHAAFACWQDLLANEWMSIPATAALEHVPMPDLGEPGAPGAFAFSDPDRIRSILTAAGFADAVIEPVTAAMTVGETVDDTMTFFADTDIAHTVFDKADPAAVQRALGAIRRALEPYATTDGVTLSGAAWLVRAST